MRIVVPADCIGALGKTLTKRLGKMRRSDAFVEAASTVAAFKARIVAARANQGVEQPVSGGGRSSRPVQIAQLLTALETWKERQRRDVEYRVLNEPAPEIPVAWTTDGSIFHAERALRRYPGGWKNDLTFLPKLFEFMRGAGHDLPAGHPAFDFIREPFNEAIIEVLNYEDRLRGGELPEQPHAVLSVPDSAASARMDAPTLRQMFERWKSAKRAAGGREKTAKEFGIQIERFVSVHGDIQVPDITRSHVREFKNLMSEYPARPGAHLAGLSVRDTIVAAKASGPYRTISSLTLRDKVVAAVSAVLSMAVDEGVVEDNAARIKIIVTPSVTPPKLPYTNDELKALFASPVFTERFRQKGGAGEASIWLPLVGLFTGARREEMGQLLVSDVKQEDDLWYIHFQTLMDEEDGMAPRLLKNVGSRRKVPVHNQLLSLGFVRYVDSVRVSEKPALFPLMKWTRERKTEAWGTWWGRYAREYVPDTRKSFHSFRHVFRRVCRNAMIEVSIRNALTGHTTGDVAEGYGRDHEGNGIDLSVLKAELDKVKYPSIDFDLIRCT